MYVLMTRGGYAVNDGYGNTLGFRTREDAERYRDMKFSALGNDSLIPTVREMNIIFDEYN